MKVVHTNGLLKLSGAVNKYIRNEGYISLKDMVSEATPEHLPPHIKTAFEEGARCLAVNCYNAAGTMFAYA
jgi:hypothetical protein